VQRQQRQGNESQEKPPYPKSPAFNGKAFSARGSAQYPAIQGTNKQRALDLTGRQPTIPQRPPGMRRLDTPPEMPRAPRPQYTNPPTRTVRRWFFILGGVFLLVALIACVTGYFLFSAINASSGPNQVAVDFLNSKNSPN
jgi:hypothetical protein